MNEKRKLDVLDLRRFILIYHIGFFIFLLMYALLENIVEDLMKFNGIAEEPYKMSTLLIFSMEIFIAYFLGFFQGISFSLYVEKKWFAIIKSIAQYSSVLFLIYVLFLEFYRLEEYIYGSQLWEPVIGSIQKAGCISVKEILGTILGCVVGKISNWSGV